MGKVIDNLIAAEHSYPIFVLHSPNLHFMAVREYLGRTKYHHWKGIFEAVAYFNSYGREEFPSIPIEDPRHPDLYDHPSYIFPAHLEPMLRLNRICKAFWEFDKSIRIFMRCAILHRQSGKPTACPNDFWVVCPVIKVSVYLAIQKFLHRFFNLETHPVDPREDPMAEDWPRIDYNNFDTLEWGFTTCNEDTEVIFYMNLLQEGAWSDGYGRQEDRLNLLRDWLFRGGISLDPFFVETMVNHDELADPPMVSYAYDLAVASFDELGPNYHSPEILTSGNDLGDLGINTFVNPLTI